MDLGKIKIHNKRVLVLVLMRMEILYMLTLHGSSSYFVAKQEPKCTNLEQYFLAKMYADYELQTVSQHPTYFLIYDHDQDH